MSDPDTEEPKPAGDWKGRGERYSNETHFSITDPDARLYRKGNQQGARLSYLAHDLIDTKGRIILRRRATLATGRAERDTALEMLDDVLESCDELGLPKRPEILTGDKGYGASDFITQLLERGIDPHVPLLASETEEELPTWKRSTFNVEHKRARNRKLNEARARNRVRQIHETRGYAVSRKLRIRSLHLFAEAKNWHGLARARRRGQPRVDAQAKLSAVVQNLKRLAAFTGRRDRAAATATAGTAFSSFFSGLTAHIRALVAHFLPTPASSTSTRSPINEAGMRDRLLIPILHFMNGRLSSTGF